VLENIEDFHLQQKYKKENITLFFGYFIVLMSKKTYLQYCNRSGTTIRRFFSETRYFVYK